MQEIILDRKVDTLEINPKTQNTWRLPPKEALGELTNNSLLYLSWGLHQGQSRWTYEDYINHPIRVALTAMRLGAGQDAIDACLLHDCLEDTLATEELILYHSSQRVLDIVKIVTRRDDETYEEYIRRIVDSGDIDAWWVKYADSTDNSILSEEATAYLLANDRDPDEVRQKYTSVAMTFMTLMMNSGPSFKDVKFDAIDHGF